MTNFVSGAANPLVRSAGGRITQAVWDNPLFQAFRDMEDRIGIRTGDLRPDPGTNPDEGPYGNMWLSVTDAANRKGVTRAALHRAVKRGVVLGHNDPDGDRVLVSARSLDRWAPMAVRPAAGRARGKTTA